MDAYVQSLNEFVYQSGIIMKPVFTTAKRVPADKRVLYAEGESERVLRAARACDEIWPARSSSAARR
jgi:malate dehydrogenase (oxaloacetate-decarboxylating)(NADP+)